MRQLLLASAAITILAACGQTGTESPKPAPTVEETATVQTETERLNIWLDEKYEEQLMMSPFQLTSLGRKDRYDEIDDLSIEAEEKQLAWALATAEELKANFDYDQLTDDAKTSYDLWLYNAKTAEDGAKWRLHGYVFEQMGGAQSQFPQFLINFHKVETEDDMTAYISRIEGAGRAINQLLVRVKLAAEKGIRPPAFAYRGALEQSQAIIAGAPFADGEDTAIWADMQGKVDALVKADTISAERGEELKTASNQALMDHFGPAYTSLINWLETDIANTEESFGVSALPDGSDFYNHRLATSTTTDLTADEVHQIGLDEVARLREQMEVIKAEFGFEGSLQEFFTFLRDEKDDERLYYPNTDEGRQGYIDDATAAIENLKAVLPDYFGILPKADLIVKRVEAFREQDGAAQHYFAGTPDGSRPGIYYAHLSDMKAMPKRELEVIAYHEGLPGHHMQISIAQELTDIPQFRTQQFFNAYVEGWALYSEQLSSEMPGTFEEPLSEFGRLGSEIWRAIRLVVDTGLHVKGWTKEEAIAYFQENSAITDGQALAEVERYLTWPGQATGYKIGMIKILELRADAKAALGDKFDIRGFHDTILGGGGVPLEILETRVDQWVEQVLAEG